MNRRDAALLTRLRLVAQGIQRPEGGPPDTSDSPLAVVRHLAAMQAQDLPGAKWSIALRVDERNAREPGQADGPATTLSSATVTAVDGALNRGEVVRSWPFRGTLHFVAADDLGWMLDLTAARTVTGAATRHRQLGLDSAAFERARAVAVRNLEGGRALTREALFSEFRAAGLDTAQNRGSHYLWYLSHTKTLCFGPMQGTSQQLVLLDEWVGQPRRLGHEEGVSELVLRYFSSHGPATLMDFLRWSNLLVRDATAGLDASRAQLESLTVDGVEYWMPAGALDAPSLRSSVHLLPGFDEYILGYADRTAALDEDYFERIVPGGNGMFMPTIVAGGRVVGTWSRKAGAKRVTLTPAPFEPLSTSQLAGVRRAAERYAAYLGLPLADAS